MTKNTHSNILLNLVAFCAAFLVMPDLDAQVRAADMIGYWNFNEGSGTTAADSSASNKNGTLNGDPQWVDAKFGKGLQLDGNDYVKIDAYSQLNNLNKTAVSFWANPTGVGYVIWRDRYALIQSQNTNKLRLRWRLDGNWRGTHTTANNSFPRNTWSHWVFNRNNGATTIYKNGSLIKSGTDSQTVSDNNTQPLYIGWRSGTDGFKGILDDVRIFKSSLTATDAATLYGNGNGDFGTAALFVGLKETSRVKESINIQFAKFGVTENVTGFDASDVTVTGGTLSNFTQISASNYSMDVKVNSWPGQATLSIAAGAAKDSSNVDIPAMSATINYIEGMATRSNNLLAHWKFDEGSGNDTYDSSSKGNHMGKGGATWTTGKFGNAFSYDAKSTPLPLAAHPPSEGTEYSISFWMNGNTTKLPGKATSIMESSGPSGRVINLHWPWNNKNLYFDSGHGSHDRINLKPPNADDNPGPLWGQWTHYVVTHNRGAGTMRIYQNEIQIGIGTGKTKALGPPVRWFLGSHNGGNGNWWYGKIDDLRIYDVELAASEVEDIYAGDIWPQLNPIITADDAGKRIQTVTVSFKVETTTTAVTGFTAADLNVTGGTVSDFAGSGSTYTFKLTPTTYPSNVSVNIPRNSLESTDGNYANISTTTTLPFKLPGFRNDSHGGLALWLDGNEITDKDVNAATATYGQGASVLKVDFGQNDTNPLQAGFQGFNPWGSSSPDNGSVQTQTYANAEATDGTIDVTMQGYTHWRDYNSITGGPYQPQSNLLSDMALRNNYGTMTLTIKDLKAGSYVLKTYHHNANVTTKSFSATISDATRTDAALGTFVESAQSRTPGTILIVDNYVTSN